MSWRFPLAAVAGICLLSGCEQQQATHEPQGTPSKAAPAPPSLPLVEPAYDREALLLAVMHAASDAARGRTREERQRMLDGKLFQLRARFGCPKDDMSEASRSWSFDETRRKLSFRIEPEIDGDTPLVRSLDVTGHEAVEGFWIRRPWMLAADCPAPVPDPAAPADRSAGLTEAAQENPATGPMPSPPRIGLAQFFSPSDARTHRRGSRAYTATQVLPPGETPSKGGYDLVINGRLRRLSNGLVIACASRANGPPDCIVSVDLDRVAIENPANGEIIATWSSG